MVENGDEDLLQDNIEENYYQNLLIQVIIILSTLNNGNINRMIILFIYILFNINNKIFIVLFFFILF